MGLLAGANAIGNSKATPMASDDDYENEGCDIEEPVMADMEYIDAVVEELGRQDDFAANEGVVEERQSTKKEAERAPSQ